MKTAVRLKWLFASFTGVALIAGAAWIYAALKGPYGCGSCTLGMPVPDQKTVEVIRNNANPWPFSYFEAGNVYIVCNASYCSQYLITDSLQLYGTKKELRSDAPGGSGGGGGEGGSRGGGGAGGGGGCVASCGQGPGSGGSGTVTVGNDEKLPPKKTN